MGGISSQVEKKGGIVMRMSKWVVQQVDPVLQKKLMQETGISAILAGLLMNRGYQNPEDIMEFLNPSLDQLSSPFEMVNMGAAVERILEAVERKDKIVVYGDYDVDGICASVMLYQGLKTLQADVDYYVPDRMEEGYGVNTPALRGIYEAGARLLVTVDCGISSWQEVAEAKSWGMDVIVTDHHQLPEILPDCIIVNPVLSNDEKDKWLLTDTIDILNGENDAYDVDVFIYCGNVVWTKEENADDEIPAFVYGYDLFNFGSNKDEFGDSDAASWSCCFDRNTIKTGEGYFQLNHKTEGTIRWNLDGEVIYDSKNENK